MAASRMGRGLHIASRRPGKPAGKPGPPAALQGRPAIGRIVRIQIGVGHGFIRLSNGREIYFHRSDLRRRATFNDLCVGDVVTFEILEDPVSGARALRVARRPRTR